GHLAGVRNTPVTHGEISAGGELVRFHGAGFHAESEAAAVFELELAVDARLVDLGVLLVVVDAQNLRAKATRVERIVLLATSARITRGAVREQCSGRNRQSVIEHEGLGPEIGADRRRAARAAGAIARHLARQRERRLAAAGDAVIRMAARTRVVVVEAEVEVFGNIPVRVEAERVQIVQLFAMLLFVTEVLVGTGELMQQHRGGNRTTRVELDAIEAVALQPDGLLAAVFGQLVARPGVIERQGDGLDRGELQGTLKVGALALHVRERVTDVVRLAVGRGVDNRRLDKIVSRIAGRVVVVDLQRCASLVVRIHAAVRRIPRLDVPVVDGRSRRARITLLVAGIQADTETLVFAGPAEDARQLGGEVVADTIGRVVDNLRAEVEHHAVVVERTRGANIDRRTDAAGGDVGAAGLVDLHRADGFRRQVREVEGTRVAADTAGDAVAAGIRVGGRHLASVQRDHVELRAEAARGDGCAFTVATVDRHAGN